LLKEGESIANINNEHVKTIPEDCYTFSYTSGTTGPPKGAMVSHKNILAFVRSFDKHSGFKVTHEDVYPSYLPLPHLMERGLAVILFFYGASIVYDRP
jgi:long-chain acyl-CoA synthetase